VEYGAERAGDRLVPIGERMRISGSAEITGIAEETPGSLDELARITGKAKSNLARTLSTMEGYGLVRLDPGERGRITPKVTHDPSQTARQ
jgi:DNA-binding transcriptional regulator GbsR (MarR family)